MEKKNNNALQTERSQALQQSRIVKNKGKQELSGSMQAEPVVKEWEAASKTEHRKRSGARRAVLLSRIDQERLAKGEISAPEEALHISDARAVRPKFYTKEELVKRAEKAAKEQALSAHEREILAQIPPHFGKI